MSKFEETVNKVTNKGKDGKEIETAPPIGNTAAMISSWDQGELEALAKSGKYEFAPQMMSLEPGQKIEGILEGMGPGNDFVNEQTGEVRHVDSWIIRSFDGSLRVSILSSAQLDRKVPPFRGGPIGIARNKDIKAGNGFKVADFHVWGPKLPEGKQRTFHMIEAKAEDKALPAASAPALPAGDATNANGASAPASQPS